MAQMVDIDWRPDARALRKFGITVLIGFGLIGAVLYLWVDAQRAAHVTWIVGAVLGVPALTGARLALPGYWLWMGVAFVLGNIMSRVLLTLIYFFVFTPIGLFRRLLGKDPLSLSRPDGSSYWRSIDGGSERHGYERQF